jgi:lysophospholipase L1-like esterase
MGPGFLSALPRRIAAGLASIALAFVLLEGIASVAVFLWNARMSLQLPPRERAHTAYDPELGWVAEKSDHAPDLYGPGISLSTNARGFRGAREYADAVPPGVTRVVCIGDSFTQGYGVGDADAWPARLERACPRVEAPNGGQAGYGVDQSYLWYARDMAGLPHQVVVAAFIADDFSRVRSGRMVGYPKPMFRLRDGALGLENVPVPRAAYLAPWLTQNLRLLDALRSVELGRRAAAALGVAPAAPVPTSEAETTQVTAALLEALARSARDRGAAPVLVLLPSLSADSSSLAPIPSYARAALANVDFPVLDLYPDFESSAQRDLFLHDPRRRGAGLHYSPQGHELVARAVAARLTDAGLLPPGACDLGARADAP